MRATGENPADCLSFRQHPGGIGNICRSTRQSDRRSPGFAGKMAAMNRILHFVAFAFFITSALAAPPAGSDPVTGTIERFLREQTRGLPGTVETAIGQLDPRMQTSACAAPQVFLPPGNRLWGKTMVGVRCPAPNSWTIYVPVQVSVRGDYLVTARTLAAGQAIADTDLATRQGDLTTLPAGFLTSPAQAVGKTMKNGLAAGLPLRTDQLLAPPVILQGQDVRLIYRGNGFSASNEGKALNSAAEGQLVRARTASGQTVSGTARSGGTVEVAP